MWGRKKVKNLSGGAHEEVQTALYEAKHRLCCEGRTLRWKIFFYLSLAETAEISDGASAVLASKAVSSRNIKADPRKFLFHDGLWSPCAEISLIGEMLSDGREVCWMSGSPLGAVKEWRSSLIWTLKLGLARPFRRTVRSRRISVWRERSARDTWLILPVVICLSQRLSHACLSTSLTKVKPRMAH